MLESREEVHNRIQQFDGITGQYYLRARFYNPVIGRFTQEDTYRGDGLNLYAYCKNNAVNYYDPSGYESASKANPYRSSEIPEGGVCGENSGNYLNEKATEVEAETGINPNNLDLMKNLLKNGQKTADGKNIVNQIDDSTKVIFRMDVGDNAHSIARYGYPNPINHINVEIQRKSVSGKWGTKWDFHMILDQNGNVDKSFETGVWTKK